MRLAVMSLMAALLLLAGCGPTPLGAKPTATPTAIPSPTPAPTATRRPTPQATPPVVVRGLDLAPAEAAQPALAAVADLAKRQGLPVEAEVKVVEVEEREWPDTSLGCPQPGMMYAQVITPGYVVVLEVEGEQYEYHTDRRANVVLCEEEPASGKGVSPTVKDGSPSQPKEGGQVDLSRITPVSRP